METSDRASHQSAGAILLALALSLAFADIAAAQVDLDNIGAAPLPSGSGARALGQGNAFTAVADDATAASWNPAGLIQLDFSILCSGQNTTYSCFSLKIDNSRVTCHRYPNYQGLFRN